jgi:hypothetical protein
LTQQIATISDDAGVPRAPAMQDKPRPADGGNRSIEPRTPSEILDGRK